MCKVNVIIPYYNRQDMIERALDSVIGQTFRDFEVILVDDGSTDKGAEVVDGYISMHPEIRFTHIRQTNGGPSKARNAGINSAKGEYIAFLDSDDSWEAGKLEVQARFMDENREYMITGTNYRIITREGKEIVKYKEKERFIRASFYKMLFKFFFCLSTVMIRREVFTGGRVLFDESKRYAEDHLLFLQIIRKYAGGRIMRPLVCQYKFEYGEGGLSNNLRQLKVNELRNFRILYDENISGDKHISIYLYLFVVLYALLKDIKRRIISRCVRR